MDYQQLQGAVSGSGRPHNLPRRVIEQNGVLIVENSDSAVAAGGSLDSSREVQDNLERRRKQKRDSARRVRGNQKRDLLRLQRTYNKNLGRKEKLEGEISRLKANAQYFESMMRTLRQMQMIPENPRPSPPPNLPVVAGAETSGQPRPSPPPTLPGVAGDKTSSSVSPVTPPVTGFDPMPTLSSEDVDLLQFLAGFLAPAGKGEAKNSYSYGGNPRDLLMNDTELRAPMPIADTVSESAALDKPNS